MTNYKYGRKSEAQIATCSGNIQRVLYRALSYGLIDISVIEGHRDKERQNALFVAGATKVTWPDGKHNNTPSDAVDCYPYDHHFNCVLTGHPDQIRGLSVAHKMSHSDINAYITMQYHKMAMVMLAAAKEEGVNMRWGGDWDMDNDTLDQSFNDLCHFEEV